MQVIDLIDENRLKQIHALGNIVAIQRRLSWRPARNKFADCAQSSEHMIAETDRGLSLNELAERYPA